MLKELHVCKVNVLWVFLILYLCLPSPSAYAYLDPGSGSYILQMLAAGMFALLYIVKLYWHRIKLFLKRLFSKFGGDSKNKP